jgi:hypothetical protein
MGGDACGIPRGTRQPVVRISLMIPETAIKESIRNVKVAFRTPSALIANVGGPHAKGAYPVVDATSLAFRQRCWSGTLERGIVAMLAQHGALLIDGVKPPRPRSLSPPPTSLYDS